MRTTFRYGGDTEEQLSLAILFVTQCPAYRIPTMHWSAAIVLLLYTSLPLASHHMILCFGSALRAFRKRVYRAQLARCAPAWKPAWLLQYILVQYIKSACADTARSFANMNQSTQYE